MIFHLTYLIDAQLFHLVWRGVTAREIVVGEDAGLAFGGKFRQFGSNIHRATAARGLINGAFDFKLVMPPWKAAEQSKRSQR